MDALERAISYLKFKPRTKGQIRKHLKDKGYAQIDIDEAIEELEAYGYVDDLGFAKLYFELGFEKGHGINRIKRELAGKGVAKDTIEDAFNELDFVPDQLEEAMALGKNILAQTLGTVEDTSEMLYEMDYNDKQKLKAKIVRRLATRGYSADIAYSVVNKLIN